VLKYRIFVVLFKIYDGEKTLFFVAEKNITMKNTKLHIKTFQELTVDELYELLRVRSEVFVVEQDCVYQDMDGDDKEAIHVWLTEGVSKGSEPGNEKVVALARVCPAGVHLPTISIGRVITTVRGKGLPFLPPHFYVRNTIEHKGIGRLFEANTFVKTFGIFLCLNIDAGCTKMLHCHINCRQHDLFAIASQNDSQYTTPNPYGRASK
jgi:ElaA protein